ncbi:MAG: acyl-CoA thioesterase [Wenzhouxiangella sp.]
MAIFFIETSVRWGDMDAFNHVSNVAYLRYIEECRAQWMESVPSRWQSAETGPVVANLTINYRRPVHWPARLRISTRPLSPGRSSIKLEHEIHALDRDGQTSELHADASTILVWVDKNSGEPVPLPVAIRELAR